MIIGFTTPVWVLTSPWTLQVFVPEPYFLRTAQQLRIMSTPNGFGHIERSLSPLYATISVEVAVLLVVAVFGWVFRSAIAGIIYLLALITMASVTLWRVSEAFRGLN